MGVMSTPRTCVSYSIERLVTVAGWLAGWLVGSAVACSRNQSYGYLPGDTKTDLTRQQPPDAAERSTGLPGDTVGPDRYTPNVAVVQANRSVGDDAATCCVLCH